MSKTVKGFKVGDTVICSTFKVDDMPDNGSFKGWATDHKVIELVDDTSIKLQMVKNPEKEITFDFYEDEPNQYYFKDGWYTGIFCDLNTMVSAYQKIFQQYQEIKSISNTTKTEENKQNESQK